MTTATPRMPFDPAADPAGHAGAEPRAQPFALADVERDVLAVLAKEGADDPETVVTRALEALVLGLERVVQRGALGSVLVLEDAKLKDGAGPSLPPAYRAFVDGVPIGPEVGSCGTAAFRRDVVIVTDIATDPLWRDYRDVALHHGLRSCWSVPILSTATDVLGTFAFYRPEPSAPTPSELAVMLDAARIARVVLERRRALRTRKRSSRRKAALFGAASVLAEASVAAASDRDAAMRDVVAAVARALDWDAGAVWLRDPTTDADAEPTLVCVAHYAKSERVRPFVEASRKRAFVAGDGLPGRVFATGAPEWLTISGGDPSFTRGEAARAAGLAEGFAIPIAAASSERLGAIELFTATPEPADTDLVLALRTVGLQVGQFLKRAQLVTDLQEEVRFTELFAGILAHDLRNPLNTLAIGASMLQGAVTSDPVAEQTLDRMKSSTARMARMIEQLLDVTRSRSGHGLPVARARMDLGELAAQIADELRIAFAGRALDVAIDGDARGEWDHDRLGQVLSNLVGNALQHTPPNASVLLRVDGRDARRVVVETRNDGVIPPEHVPSLFDPFRRAPSSRFSRGLGLGLYITKLIVTSHGGTVDVTSDAAHGTTFRVELPRR